VRENVYKGDYIEYVRGTLPIVLASPHGGSLTPREIPERRYGIKDGDFLTHELALEIALRLFEEGGGRVCLPHLVFCHLDRKKLDANRDLEEAAQGNAGAEKAWFTFHSFIECAKADIVSKFGVGHFFDIQYVRILWFIFLSYVFFLLFSGCGEAETLVGNCVRDYFGFEKRCYEGVSSSIRCLLETLNQKKKVECCLGECSIGGILTKMGIPAKPHVLKKDRNDLKVKYSGGYNTRRHGSLFRTGFNATQIESTQKVRKTEEGRKEFAKAFSRCVQVLFTDFYQFKSIFESP